jgi:hypothetical protein
MKKKRFLFEWWKVCMRITEGPFSWRKHSFGAWGMIKETLECVTMWVSVTSYCHIFKKFQSHQKPNADFVRKKWPGPQAEKSMEFTNFPLLGAQILQVPKTTGFVWGFWNNPNQCLRFCFLHSKNWNWWFTDWEVSENQNQWLSTKWNTCPTQFETHNPDLR